MTARLTTIFLTALLPMSFIFATIIPSDYEFTITSGLSFNQFLDRRIDSQGNDVKVFQRYNSCAPFTQWRIFNHISPQVFADFKIATSYDIDPYATNVLNDGAEVDPAHASIIDFKMAALYRPDMRTPFLIGLGIGAGNFGLHTDSLPGDYAINYIHCYLPFIRAQHTYELAGYQAQWELEISRIDVILFQGYGFEATHHLWFYQTPEQDQGFFISTSYWDLRIPLLIFQPNVNDSLRSLKFGWEVNFH